MAQGISPMSSRDLSFPIRTYVFPARYYVIIKRRSNFGRQTHVFCKLYLGLPDRSPAQYHLHPAGPLGWRHAGWLRRFRSKTRKTRSRLKNFWSFFNFKVKWMPPALYLPWRQSRRRKLLAPNFSIRLTDHPERKRSRFSGCLQLEETLGKMTSLQNGHVTVLAWFLPEIEGGRVHCCDAEVQCSKDDLFQSLIPFWRLTINDVVRRVFD